MQNKVKSLSMGILCIEFKHYMLLSDTLVMYLSQTSTHYESQQNTQTNVALCMSC